MSQVTWKKLVPEQATDASDLIPPLPSRLVTDEDLKQFCEAMKISDVPNVGVESNGVKRKSGSVGGPDTQHYGRGKRAREVCLYILFIWIVFDNCICCLLFSLCMILHCIVTPGEFMVILLYTVIYIMSPLEMMFKK